MGVFDLFKRKTDQSSIEQNAEVVRAETTAEEDLIGSIKQFRSQQSEVRYKFLEEHDKKLAPIHEKIERSENFMRESGLNESITALLKHIWHWSSWSKKPTFPKYAAFVPESIEGGNKGTRYWNLSFKYHNHAFDFIFEEEKSDLSSNSKYASVALSCDGEKVIEINCYSDLDREYDDWSYDSVRLLSVGDWVKCIVEMHELIKLHDVKSTREFGEKMFSDHAKDLPD